MVHRVEHVRQVRRLLARFPVVGLLGPRQVGKTTLARQVASAIGGRARRFDLEDSADLALFSDPMLTLRPLKGLVVLDEIQLLPRVYGALRVLADRPGRPARFLVLGSASPALLRQAAESLAGRIAYHELRGFSSSETGTARLDRLWLRGGFPLAFLAPTEGDSIDWRRHFVKNLLEHDMPQLDIRIPAPTLGRFWKMLAHYHGLIWNASEFARSFGVSDHTVRHYLDALVATFVLRELQPWHASIAKRQVKAPKIYIADSGLLHVLLDIRSLDGLMSHPKSGASWEGFGIGEAVTRLGALPDECHFWATHAGAELDLLVVRGRRRIGFEFKRTGAPAITASMRIAERDLALDRLYVVHAGSRTFRMDRKILAVPLSRLRLDVPPLPAGE